jgi:flagellar biosynthesis component FlhA
MLKTFNRKVKLFDSIEEELKENPYIDKRMAQSIAKKCNTNFEEVKKSVITLRKKMVKLRRRESNKTEIELIVLAISEIKRDITPLN